MSSCLTVLVLVSRSNATPRSMPSLCCMTENTIRPPHYLALSRSGFSTNSSNVMRPCWALNFTAAILEHCGQYRERVRLSPWPGDSEKLVFMIAACVNRRSASNSGISLPRRLAKNGAASICGFDRHWLGDQPPAIGFEFDLEFLHTVFRQRL